MTIFPNSAVQNAYKLEKPYSFDTAFLSLIEADSTDELLTYVEQFFTGYTQTWAMRRTTGLFTHFFQLDTTVAERQFFKRLAQLIGTRAARLSSCGIAAIASKMGYAEQVSKIF